MYVSFHRVFATSECLWAKHRYRRPFPSLPEIWKLGWGFCNDRLLRPRFSAASGDELREDLLWNWRLRLLNLNQIPPLNPTPCLTLLPFILLSYRFSSIEFLIVLLVQCVVLLGIRFLFLAVRKNSICRRRKPNATYSFPEKKKTCFSTCGHKAWPLFYLYLLSCAVDLWSVFS